MLNIEAYPNPTPVILEITAQRPASWEMERYYTRPMDWPLHHAGYRGHPLDIVLWTFFRRVSFKYGVDYFFAYSQAAVAWRKNVNLPGIRCDIQANS